MRRVSCSAACLVLLVACGSEVIVNGGRDDPTDEPPQVDPSVTVVAVTAAQASSGAGAGPSTTSGPATTGSGASGGMGGMGGMGGYLNACPAPTPTVLAYDGGWRFGMDATHLYYSVWDPPHDLRRVDKCGGPPETLAVVAGHGVDIAVTGGYVYMAMQSGTGRSVMRVPVTGGTPENFSPPPGGQAEKIYTDGTNIFWSELRGTMWLMQQPISSSSSIVLASDIRSRNFDIDGTHAYFFENDGLKRIPKGGGVVEVVALVQSQGGPRDVQVDSSGIYFAFDWGAMLQHVPAPGGPATTLASGGNIVSIALDPTYIYISEHSAGTLDRMTKQGTGRITLASGFPVMEEVLLDNNSVYWLALGLRQLVKLDQ